MTYSIMAVDAVEDTVGVAVASCWPAVGAVVPAAMRSVGVAVSQGDGDPQLAERLVDGLHRGLDPTEVLDRVVGTVDTDRRQLAVLAVSGSSAVFNGPALVAPAGAARRDGVVGIANLAGGAGVPEAMVEAFEGAYGDVADRLLVALVAGRDAGGDARGQQSAALVVVGPPGAAVDVRIDHATDPLEALGRASGEQRALAVVARGQQGGGSEAFVDRVLALARTDQVRFWLSLRLAEEGADELAGELMGGLPARPWRDVLERSPAEHARALARRVAWTSGA